MKYILSIIFPIVLFMVLFSCKNDTIPKPSGTASFTIVNAIAGSTSLVPNFDSQKKLLYFSTAAQINYAGYMEFSSYVGNIPLAICDYSDTTKVIYKASLNIPAYSIESLFLTGTLTAPESVLTTDKIPVFASADSLCGIRFINLSSGSNPVSVDIQGKPNGSEVSSLSYKNITTFKTYSAKWNITDYNFEFRDAVSGTVLASYDLSGVNYGDDGDQNQNSVRNHSFTIVFYGQPGSQGAFLVNNY